MDEIHWAFISGFKYMGVGDISLAMGHLKAWYQMITSDGTIPKAKILTSILADEDIRGINGFAIDSIHLKTIFTTNRGYVGCGVHSLRAGESIVSISGLIMPIALRQDGNFHRLVCPLLISSTPRSVTVT
jgi:hypothetical protein